MHHNLFKLTDENGHKISRHSLFKKERQSVIILQKDSKFIFNRSFDFSVNPAVAILAEAYHNAPIFTKKILKKYFPDYEFDNIQVETIVDRAYSVLEIVDLSNYQNTDQRELNEIKREFAARLNANIKDFSCPIQIKVPTEVKQAAQIILWYDYLRTIQSKFNGFKPGRMQQYTEIALFHQKSVTSRIIKDTIEDLPTFSYSRSFSEFNKNLTEYLNGKNSLYSIPILLTTSFKITVPKKIQNKVPKYHTKCLIKKLGVAKKVIFTSHWVNPDKLNPALAALRIRMQTSSLPLF